MASSSCQTVSFKFLFQCRAAFFSRIDALLGEFRVGCGVHDSYTFHCQCGLVPGSDSWHSHQVEGTDGLYCLLRKTLAKRGKWNCQSSEAKSFRSGTRTIDRPVAGRRSNPLGHHAPPPFFVYSINQSQPVLCIGENVGRNLRDPWIALGRGQSMDPYCAQESMDRARHALRDLADFAYDANHFTIAIPRWRRHIY